MPARTARRSPDAAEVERECIALRVRMLNRVVSTLYDEALQPHGLKISQMNILVVISRLGLARAAELCWVLKIDPSTLSRNLERLRRNGWVEAVPERDQRSQPCRLTLRGRKVLRQALPAWREAQRQAADLLGRRGVESLGEMAREIQKKSPGEVIY